MKQGIHPEYVECKVRCSCGNTWTTRSTKSEMRVDLCDKCHPFYTGTQKLVDTGGRVQRFADKFGGAAAAQLKKAEEAKAARAAKAAERQGGQGCREGQACRRVRQEGRGRRCRRSRRGARCRDHRGRRVAHAHSAVERPVGT